MGYKNRYRSRKKFSTLRVALLSILIISLVSTLWATTNTINPGEALSRAHTLLNNPEVERNKLQEVEALCEIAAQEKLFLPWARLLQGQALESSGDRISASGRYRLVPEDSAAYFDAKLSLISLELDDATDHIKTSSNGRANERTNRFNPETAPLSAPNSTNPVAADWESLEKNILSANREDLIPKFTLLRGRSYQALGDYQKALEQYRNVRLRARGSPTANEARNLAFELLGGVLPFSSLPEGERLAEIDTLIRERDGERALERIDESLDALDQEKRADPKELEFERLKLQKLREQALRFAKRANDADSLLVELAQAKIAGISDQALLTIAKNSWNVNDHHRALETLLALREQFPRSPLIAESRYVQGRVLEELGEISNAQSAYRAIRESAPELHRLALKRTAWLALLKKDETTAEREFRSLLSLVNVERKQRESALGEVFPGRKLSTEESRLLREFEELKEDELHASYWLAKTLRSRGAEDAAAKEESDRLLEIIATSSRRGYYGTLARRALQRPADSTLEPKSINGLCALVAPTPLQVVVQQFERFPLLSKYAEREIDWHMAQSAAESEVKDASDPLYPYRHLVTRASLFQQIGATSRSVKLAEAGLRRLTTRLTEDDSTQVCENRLIEIGYPIFLPELFRNAAKQHGIDLALFYAIARTESHFDPDAVSVVGARGLVQLMPATAKMEGWDGTSPLSDPRVNLPLGAKHLARTIRDYSGNLYHAIAAYNAGGAAVNRWRSRFPGLSDELWAEFIGYPETNKYVKHVIAAAEIYRLRSGSGGDKS